MGWDERDVTAGPRKQGLYLTDNRPAEVQLDKPRQNTPFLTLAHPRLQPPLADSTAPPVLGYCLNLRPSDRQK